MTTTEIKELVRESALWQLLLAGDKIDALLYVLERAGSTLEDRAAQPDISDIIAEIFDAGNRPALR